MGADNIYTKLYQEIKNAYGVVGLMGNLKAESGLKTNKLEKLCKIRLNQAGKGEYSDEKYTTEINEGKIGLEEFLHPLPGRKYGYGLAQWTSPARKRSLYSFAKQRGVSIADEDMQLDFLVNELKTDYKSVWNTLCAAKSVKEASDKVLTGFEAPANISENTKKYRADLGIKLLNEYKNRTEEGVKMNNAYARGKKLLGGDYSQWTVSGKSYLQKLGRYSKVPQRGSIVYFYYKNKGRVAHVEIVVDVKQHGDLFTIQTIGGNTSGRSIQRNGGEVARHIFTFRLNQVGGGNKLDGFAMPVFNEHTCDIETFIKVVEKEEGYLEKSSGKDLQHKTLNAGSANYTKYGEWYGSNGVFWCQQFVSWCSYEACRVYLECRKTMWVRENNSWRYMLNGNYVKGEWKYIGGRWYVFDEAGNAIAGWFQSDDDWYYLNPADNAMLAGQWIEDKGNSYYLTKTGVMARSAYIKSQTENKYYWVGETGEYESGWDSSNPDLAKYDLAE